MSTIVIRPAARADLAQITSIYNYYVLNTPITFDIEPVGPEQRVEWFNEHTQGALSTFRKRRPRAHSRLLRHGQVPQQSRVRYDRGGNDLLRAGRNRTWRRANDV